MTRTKSYLEQIYEQDLKNANVEWSSYEREWKFHAERKWRFDFAWPEDMLAVEIEGGTYSKHLKSRHTTGDGFHQDCEKYNQATIAGWRVLRFDSRHVLSGEAVKQTLAALKMNSLRGMR